jgi:hypothetical protein
VSRKVGTNLMKNFYIKLAEAAIILVLLIVFIFLLVDCKMEGEKMRLKIAILEENQEKKLIETQEIRKAYSSILIKLVDENRITIAEISSSLPGKEFEVFTEIQNGKND